VGISETEVRAAFANDIFPVFSVRHPVNGEGESECGEIGSFDPKEDPLYFSKKDLVIVHEELDRFEREYRIGAHAGELPAPETASNWPWGAHETELLRHLAAAAKRFWVNYEPGEPDTAPTNADVADFLKKNPKSNRNDRWTHGQHGNRRDNIKLSQVRADSIRAYLINNFDVRPSRVKALGYGPDRPVASNKTAEGRQKNRRVVASFE